MRQETPIHRTRRQEPPYTYGEPEASMRLSGFNMEFRCPMALEQQTYPLLRVKSSDL